MNATARCPRMNTTNPSSCTHTHATNLSRWAQFSRLFLQSSGGSVLPGELRRSLGRFQTEFGIAARLWEGSHKVDVDWVLFEGLWWCC